MHDRKPRRWRYLDTCQFTTWIEAEVPRVKCPTHGLNQIPIPWGMASREFTAWFGGTAGFRVHHWPGIGS
jgi:transposase